MIINEGECIICDSSEEYNHLIHDLNTDGYKLWSGNALYGWGRSGVRWTPGDGPFPNCLCYVPYEIKDELLACGRIQKTSYTDHGVLYRVKRYSDITGNGNMVEVDDLL